MRAVIPWARSLATTTSRRRGVARNVVVIVSCRYSPAMPTMPTKSAMNVRMLAGAPTAPATPHLPLGVHRLTATTPDGRTAQAQLIVAPRRAPAPPPRALPLRAPDAGGAR